MGPILGTFMPQLYILRGGGMYTVHGTAALHGTYIRYLPMYVES